MNTYKSLNEIINYIENHLEEKIDFNILAKILGVNTYTLQRIFSLLTNITLTDYIRKRRLSIAGEELYLNNEKIIDIALKYGYENPTSFSRAFEQFHGILPSQVTKDTKLKIYPKLEFEEKDESKEAISYEIIELDEIVLYGIAKTTDDDHIEFDAPEFFTKIENENITKYGPIDYGMVTYVDECRLYCNAYWTLYKKEIPGYEKVVIPKSKWLLFKIDNQTAEDIRNMSQRFYKEVVPSSSYNLRDLPELEYYHDDVTDFLVPID